MEEQFGGDRKLRISPPDLIVKVGAAALGTLALFLLIQSVKTLKEYRYVGSGVAASNTITVSGMGEVFAVPDRATFTVTVREEAAEVTTAQDKATEKANAIIAYLKGAGVEEKNIKTVNYNVNPKYEWEQSASCSSGYCPPGKQTLVGFEVWQMIEVKVQDPKKAGELLTGVGGRGASEVSGLSFTIEDEDELKAEAREMAITEAREKAEALADQLGVKVVRVVGFYEDAYGSPSPYYGKGGIAMDAALSVREATPPELPTGENKIMSNVNVTYEIR
jgi:uncharacterized protein YggE